MMLYMLLLNIDVAKGKEKELGEGKNKKQNLKILFTPKSPN